MAQRQDADLSGRRNVSFARAGGLAKLDAQDDEDDAPHDGPNANDPNDGDQAGTWPDEHQNTEQNCQRAADDAPDPSATGGSAMAYRRHDLKDADDDRPNSDEDRQDREAHTRPDKDENPEEDADGAQYDPQRHRGRASVSDRLDDVEDAVNDGVYADHDGQSERGGNWSKQGDEAEDDPENPADNGEDPNLSGQARKAGRGVRVQCGGHEEDPFLMC
jgi:hypothetical protein